MKTQSKYFIAAYLLFFVSGLTCIWGAEGMRVDFGGNVGIGITTPLQKLHVAGNAIISGNVTIHEALMLKQKASAPTTPVVGTLHHNVSGNLYMFRGEGWHEILMDTDADDLGGSGNTGSGNTGSPPVSGYVLWVDASGLAAMTSGNAATTPVSNLGSQGGSFNVGTYDVIASGIGSKNALKFDGTAQHLLSTDAYTNTGTTLTMFMVANLVSAGSEYDGYVSCVLPPNKDFNHASGFACNNIGGSTVICARVSNIASRTVPSAGTPWLTTFKFDATNLTNYVKHGATDTNAVAGSTGTFGCTKIAIGCRLAGDPSGVPSSFSPVYIGEVLIYNSALSDTDREAVESYLVTKWGI